MDTFEAIKKRVSVREYESRPITKEILEKIADAGRLAPTARGDEPWEFVAVTNRKTLEELGTLVVNGPFLADAGAAIVVFCRETKYYVEDGSAATENMLIAATALGVGSCWVAGDKKPYAESVAEKFGAPQGTKLLSIIALGYPPKDVKPTKKRSLKSVLHWEHF